jgi:phenylalanyl-tRNA synthetase alpha chain
LVLALKMLKLLNFRPQTVLTTCHRHLATSIEAEKHTFDLKNQSYNIDDYSNCTPKILAHLDRNLHLQKNHPLSLIRQRIVNYFYNAFLSPRGNPMFSVHDNLEPIVSVQQNFDNLLIAKDHPSRAKSDCYYLNREYLLRAHTTAHQVSMGNTHSS